jgi:hypothetical protein
MGCAAGYGKLDSDLSVCTSRRGPDCARARGLAVRYPRRQCQCNGEGNLWGVQADCSRARASARAHCVCAQCARRPRRPAGRGRGAGARVRCACPARALAPRQPCASLPRAPQRCRPRPPPPAAPECLRARGGDWTAPPAASSAPAGAAGAKGPAAESLRLTGPPRKVHLWTARRSGGSAIGARDAWGPCRAQPGLWAGRGARAAPACLRGAPRPAVRAVQCARCGRQCRETTGRRPCRRRALGGGGGWGLPGKCLGYWAPRQWRPLAGLARREAGSEI